MSEVYISKYQWRKNGGVMRNLIRHRKNAYWSKACANRWLKRNDDDFSPASDIKLLVIYHYPKWYIKAWREGNLMEVIKERNENKPNS